MFFFSTAAVRVWIQVDTIAVHSGTNPLHSGVIVELLENKLVDIPHANVAPSESETRACSHESFYRDLETKLELILSF